MTTGMNRGKVPFKYLGVNVSSKRLSVLDCACLVEKVADRIRGMGSRNLSYAGRIVLIKSVYSSLHNYWARIFILPRTVLKQIEAICRDYLWHGKEIKGSPALVAWENLCRPKSQGGLGITDLVTWNTAALGKYVWWVEKKADHLWVKWVHAIYIKGKAWKDYQPTNSMSWAWRKICQVKDILKDFMYGTWRQGNVQYSIKTGYSWLRPEIAAVEWYPWILNRWLIPKHCFISWLLIQQRLLTQDRLIKMRITSSQNLCYLCGLYPEDHNHLFLSCDYSSACCKILADWCKVKLPFQNCVQWWLQARFRSSCRKKVIGLILAALFYHVWLCRNRCFMEGALLRPEKLVDLVKRDVQNRLSLIELKSTKVNVIEWVMKLRA